MSESQQQETEVLREVNILLLGQTGVGKSTFINAFANYLKFQDFESAKNGILQVLIPCQFTIMDEAFEEHTVRSGSASASENLGTGQSATQDCRTYEFHHEGRLVRLFDTPGVGDTRGQGQDKKNLKKILDELFRFQFLHGICVLLKPNESKLTVSFKDSVKQVLNQLQKSALKNMVFVFTHTRGRPGDTVPTLKALMKEVAPEVELLFNGKNTLCLDNDVFRFLLARKNTNIVFSAEEQEEYASGWTRAQGTCVSLLKHVLERSEEEACGTRELICVNNVRATIEDLAQPLVNLVRNFATNAHVLDVHVDNLRACAGDADRLKELLYVPNVKLEFAHFEAPRTVCRAEACAGNAQICCRVCACADGELRHCNAFHAQTGNCLVCGCPWDRHHRKYYETVENVEKKMEIDIIREIDENVSIAIDRMMKKIEAKKIDWNNEKKMVIEHSAKLSVFLEHHSITNDSVAALDDCFREHVARAESLCRAGRLRPEVLKYLRHAQTEYQAEKAIVKPEAEALSAEEMFRLITEVSAMKLSREVFVATITMETQRKGSKGPNWLLYSALAAGAAVGAVAASKAGLDLSFINAQNIQMAIAFFQEHRDVILELLHVINIQNEN